MFASGRHPIVCIRSSAGFCRLPAQTVATGRLADPCEKSDQMEGVIIVAIVFSGIVLALAVIGSTILMGIKIIKGGVSRKERKHQIDETRMIQELYQGLDRMEKRVETLETILIEKEKRDQSQ
jgi:phage shock protein B